MPTAFGSNVWLGWAEETTYGTPVNPPTKFIEITSESLTGEQSWISIPTLRSPSQGQRVRSKKSVSGSFSANLGFNGFVPLFKHLLGASVTSGSAAPWEHTNTPTNALPVGLTLHLNRDAANVGNAFQYSGCQIQRCTISQRVEELCALEFEVIGRNFANIAVATPTFVTFEPVTWEMFKGVTFGANTITPKEVEIVIENNLAEDRYNLGARERVGLGRSGPRKVTAKVTAEFDSMTVYNEFKDLTDAQAIEFLWDSGTPATSGYRMFWVTGNAALTKAEAFASEAGPIDATFEWEFFQISAPNSEVTIKTQNGSSTI